MDCENGDVVCMIGMRVRMRKDLSHRRTGPAYVFGIECHLISFRIVLSSVAISV